MSIHSQLEKFDKKKSPTRISLNYENAINYDIYSVYIKHPLTGEQYLFKSYHNGLIQVNKWNTESERFDIADEINSAELTEDSFSGTFFYKAHQAEFNSLKDLVWWREWCYKRRAEWENFNHSRAKYRYRMKQHKIERRMLVLDALIDLYLDKDEQTPVPFINLMNKVYSSLWIYHDQSERMKKEVRMSLSAFESTADVIRNDNFNYTPTGKSLLTQEKYLDDEKKYKELKTIQVRMFWAAVASFVAALGSACAAFMALPK